MKLVAILRSCTFRDVSFNQLTDGLNELANMASLTTVYFNNNQFTGTLSFLPHLTKLQFLHGGNNRLTGFIPPDIGFLYDLYGLYVACAACTVTVVMFCDEGLS